MTHAAEGTVPGWKSASHKSTAGHQARKTLNYVEPGCSSAVVNHTRQSDYGQLPRNSDANTATPLAVYYYVAWYQRTNLLWTSSHWIFDLGKHRLWSFTSQFYLCKGWKGAASCVNIPSLLKLADRSLRFKPRPLARFLQNPHANIVRPLLWLIISRGNKEQTTGGQALIGLLIWVNTELGLQTLKGRGKMWKYSEFAEVGAQLSAVKAKATSALSLESFFCY